uniref:Secreted protein n=1 Tax=Parascaris univalens TaxID=6257 RepID=A0A914ZQD5_PARUN
MMHTNTALALSISLAVVGQTGTDFVSKHGQHEFRMNDGLRRGLSLLLVIFLFCSIFRSFTPVLLPRRSVEIGSLKGKQRQARWIVKKMRRQIFSCSHSSLQ